MRKSPTPAVNLAAPGALHATPAKLRRGAALALALTLVAGCMPKPDFSYVNSYEPFYFALTTAQQNFQDLGVYRGNPVGAARALAQFEFIIAEINDQVAEVALVTSATALLASGDREIRRALGVAPGVSNRDLSHALRRFANAQAAGQGDAAMAALGPPVFTMGPQATLAVLTNLPPLPAVQSVAADLDRAANSMSTFTPALR